MATELDIIPRRRLDDDDDDSAQEGDAFFDPKGKGKDKKVQPSADDISLQLSEREAQEKLDEELARGLHEQSMREYEQYQRNQARMTNASSSTSPPVPEPEGRPGGDFDIHEFLRQEQLTQMRARGPGVPVSVSRLDHLLPRTHNVVLVLLPLCGAELLLVVVAPIVAHGIFHPLGKAQYVWIVFGGSIKCLLGLFLAGLCQCIHKAHLPSLQPPKPIGLVRDSQLLYRLASNLDLFIVIFFTFVLSSGCLVALSLGLSAWGWTTKNSDAQAQCLFVLIIAAACAALLLLQCLTVPALYNLLRIWPTIFRRDPEPPKPPQVTPPPLVARPPPLGEEMPPHKLVSESESP